LSLGKFRYLGFRTALSLGKFRYLGFRAALGLRQFRHSRFRNALGLDQLANDPRQGFEFLAQQQMPKLRPPLRVRREQLFQIAEVANRKRHRPVLASSERSPEL
jgi:hypothetical protein